MDGPGQVRSVLWRRVDGPGLERCVLWRRDFGWELAGTLVTAFDEGPGEVRYRVECDPAWVTRRVEATVLAGRDEGSLMLTVDAELRWSRDGSDVPDLAGCADADLGVSPSTNTLPIRRLGLPVGQAAEVDAAWVGFPELRIERLPQRYERIAPDRYRYRSLARRGAGAQVASGASGSPRQGEVWDIDVDELGLVSTYHGLFERAADWTG